MNRTMSHIALAVLVAGLSVSTLPFSSRALAVQPGPVFSFPSSGTTYPYTGSYLFQVQPVAEAKGYLWSFIQDGAIRYQNLSDEGSLSGLSYTIKPGSTAQHRMHVGPLTVTVRAALSLTQWTAASSITIQLQGKGTPSRPQPKPNSGPPAPGTVLYQTDTSGGLDKWAGSPDWKHLNGMLVNDGSADHNNNFFSWIPAPYEPGHIANYAVEVQMQIAKECGGFGVVVREKNQAGYWAGGLTDVSCNAPMGVRIYAYNQNNAGNTIPVLGEQSFSFNADWHTIRIEARDNVIRLLIDGALIIQAVDNRYLAAGQVGIWCSGTQLNVRSFKVIAL